MKSVTYNTTCWEKDWEAMLTTEYIQRNIEFNDYPFAKKVLWINNVEDYSKVSNAAQKLIEEGVLTHFYKVDDVIEDAMRHFHLSRADNSLGRGFPYSVGPLCGIYMCDTDWFLHYTGDATLTEKATRWIPKTMAYMARNENYKTGNLMWARGRSKISWGTLDRESHFQDDDWAVGYGFSDQCFLAETQMLKTLDYNMQHKLSDKRFSKQRKPGTSFEKRIEAWKLNNNFHRVTYKQNFYVHAAELNKVIKSLRNK